MPARSLIALTLLCLSLIGCAPSPEPSSATGAPPQVKRARMALLPVENEAFPELAAALNAQLSNLQVAGIEEGFTAKVSLEVAQLSVECVEPTSECYVAVGRTLSVSKLLLPRIAAAKIKRRKAVKVTVTLFDVDAAAPIRTVERLFPSAKLAVAGLPAMADELRDGPATPTAATEERPVRKRPRQRR